MINQKHTSRNKTKPSINYRRLWHLALTFIILTLLFFISLLSYNEIINEKKLVGIFNELNNTEKLLSRLDSTNLDYIKGQESLFKYLISHNEHDIKDYFASLHKVNSTMETARYSNGDLRTPKIDMNRKNNDLESNKELSLMIDSLSNDIFQNIKSDEGFKSRIKRLNYNDLKIKTTIETKSSVDSVEKKKLFGRLGDAIKGEVGVQREQKEVLMIIEYEGQKSAGSIEKQMENIVKMTAEYYEKELNKLKLNFDQLTQKNQNILLNTMNIQRLSDDVLSHYKNTLLEQKNILSKKYSTQYSKNRITRLYALFGIAFLLIILSFAVLYLTTATYKIEEKLLIAKEKLSNNLILKNKMVSMISHDIRSPLSIILLYIKQVLKLEKDPQKKEVFDSISYTTNSAFLLANRILDFSKGENGQMTVYKDKFNLHDEINHIVAGFSALAKTKRNELINTNKLERSSEVVFDRLKLQRLYFNLLDNAIKFTENGIIEVISKWELIENERYKFTLTVKDSGQGISEESLKKVFEPFEQASSIDLAKQDLGVGLGLYLCKEITELFDGSIRVQSKLKEGTTVSAVVYINKENQLV